MDATMKMEADVAAANGGMDVAAEAAPALVASVKEAVERRLLKAAGTLAEGSDGLMTRQAGAWVSLGRGIVHGCSHVGTDKTIRLAVDWQLSQECLVAVARMQKARTVIESEGCPMMAEVAKEKMEHLERITDEYALSVAWEMGRETAQETEKRLTEVLETFVASDVYYHKRAASTNALKAVVEMRRYVSEKLMGKKEEVKNLKRGRSA